jgi:hypothetical protein
MLGNEGQHRKDRSGNDRLDVNGTCLALNLPKLCCVGNRFRADVHVALTARCEPHSRFVARLEDAECSDIEHEEERKPPQ